LKVNGTIFDPKIIWVISMNNSGSNPSLDSRIDSGLDPALSRIGLEMHNNYTQAGAHQFGFTATPAISGAGSQASNKRKTPLVIHIYCAELVSV
jgi:hypothetical protein